MNTARVVLVADRDREDVSEPLTHITSILESKAQLIASISPDEPIDTEADLAVVVGGDGTILSQGRKVLDSGIPIAGINVGRLGFLAEFEATTFQEHVDSVLSADRTIRERMTMEVSIERANGETDGWHAAVNDCVVTAGPPFRMIELRIEFDGFDGPHFAGDGVIVATPTGSTAYNVSAGGPIVHPECEAFALTPIAAHSLAFRPIIAAPHSPLGIEVLRANEGTTLVLDGQLTWVLEAGDTVRIRRGMKKLKLVHDPKREFWETVASKMRWATGPSYRDR